MKNISDYQNRIRSAGGRVVGDERAVLATSISPVKESKLSIGDKISFFVTAVGFFYMVSLGVTAYNDRRERNVLESNCCGYIDRVAEENSSYRGWATEAIKESRDLGRLVGVVSVEDIIREKNNNKQIVFGQKYEVLDCGCN